MPHLWISEEKKSPEATISLYFKFASKWAFLSTYCEWQSERIKLTFPFLSLSLSSFLSSFFESFLPLFFCFCFCWATSYLFLLLKIHVYWLVLSLFYSFIPVQVLPPNLFLFYKAIFIWETLNDWLLLQNHQKLSTHLQHFIFLSL